MKRLLAGIIILALLLLGLSACLPGDETPTPQPQPTPEESEVAPVNEDVSTPLTFTLSEGSENADIPVPSAYVRGEALAGEDLASLLARLPALAACTADITDFNFPDEVIPRRKRRGGMSEAYSFKGGPVPCSCRRTFFFTRDPQPDSI
jgi:hypothetical protein